MASLPAGYKLITEPSAFQRLIIGLWSRPGCGKSNFCLTAPDPIAYMDLDLGLETVIDKFCMRKKIYHKAYNFSKEGREDINQSVKLWDGFKSDYKALATNPEVESVIMDTSDTVWELARLARLGRLSNVLPRNYGPVNAEFEDLLTIADMVKKNFIFTMKMADEYVNDKFTGKQKRTGYKNMEYITQVNLHLWKEEGEFGATIVKCRPKPELEGMQLYGDMITFDTVYEMVMG